MSQNKEHQSWGLISPKFDPCWCALRRSECRGVVGSAFGQHSAFVCGHGIKTHLSRQDYACLALKYRKSLLACEPGRAGSLRPPAAPGKLGGFYPVGGVSQGIDLP